MFRDFMKRSAAKELESAGEALNKTPSVGIIEQSAAAAGHVLGMAAGGAAIGAGVNGYEYSQTGMGYGGSFSMTESVLSGAAVGAIGGGIVGGFGAKKAAMSVTANANRINKNLAKAEDRMLERGLGVAGRNTRMGLTEKVNASNRIDSDRSINTPKNPPRSTQTAQMTQPLNPVNHTVQAPQPAGKKKKKRR